MSCPDRELLFLHTAGALDEAEAAGVERHLEGCAECTAAHEAERETLATLAGGLPPVAPPPQVRRRLLQRVRGEAPARPRSAAPAPARRRPSAARFARAAGLAAAAGLVGFGLATQRLAPAHEQALAALEARAADLADEAQAASEEVERLEEQIAEQDEELASLEADLAAAADVARLLGTAELVVFDLATTADDDAWGRVLWDDEYRCYFRAAGLPPLPADQHYVLWMVGPDGIEHAAGTLAPAAGGGSTLFTRLPRELRPVVKGFVTAETSEAPAAPSDQVVLLGEAAIGG